MLIMNNFENKIQLNKYLAQAGLCSRRKAEELIKSGQIIVNDNIVKECYFRVADFDIVKYKNNIIGCENKKYILLNKPRNYITTLSDEKNRKTVLDLIKPHIKERVFPVGRLDRASTGLLLLTNDGHLSQMLAHPSYNIQKTYIVTLDRPLDQKDLNRLLVGIHLFDGFVKPDYVNYIGQKSIIKVIIHSGKNRIIRRMFEALFYKVMQLDRISYAFLTKKNIAQGQWRLLSEQEVNNLKQLKKINSCC